MAPITLAPTAPNPHCTRNLAPTSRGPVSVFGNVAPTGCNLKETFAKTGFSWFPSHLQSLIQMFRPMKIGGPIFRVVTIE